MPAVVVAHEQRHVFDEWADVTRREEETVVAGADY